MQRTIFRYARCRLGCILEFNLGEFEFADHRIDAPQFIVDRGFGMRVCSSLMIELFNFYQCFVQLGSAARGRPCCNQSRALLMSCHGSEVGGGAP
jgi:hypothetical protein